MKFKYQAKTKEGEMQVGFVDANDRETAVNILSSHDLFILSLEGTDQHHWYDLITHWMHRVRSQDMVVFTRQLAVLLESHLPLNKALSVLYDQTTNPSLKEAIFEISEDVDAGLTFYQALERQNNIFSEFYVSMIRSAEVTGNLDEVSAFLADYTEREANLAGKAKSALIYPAIVVTLFVAVVAVMVTVVFPQLQPIFEQSGVQMPWFATAMIGSGMFLAQWWAVVLIIVTVFLAIFFNYLHTSEGRALLDDYKIRMPVIKRVFVPITIARFANASAMLIKGGVPVAQAMEIVGETVDNILYRDLLHDVSDRIRQGEAMSETLARYPEYFPLLVSQMVAVGEKTGRLTDLLLRVANFYTKQADSMLTNAVELIQPLLMIAIGVVVGLLFASILLPLYQLTSTIQ